MENKSFPSNLLWLDVLENCTQLWQTRFNKGRNELEQVQMRATQMEKDLETKRFEEQLKEPGRFSLQER